MDLKYIPEEIRDAWAVMPKHVLDDIITRKKQFIIDKMDLDFGETWRYRTFNELPNRDVTCTHYLFLFSEILNEPVYLLKYEGIIKC